MNTYNLLISFPILPIKKNSHLLKILESEDPSDNSVNVMVSRFRPMF